MSLTNVQGDLLKAFADGEVNTIIHGCNCFNTMGAGIARAIALKYPDAEVVDASTPRGDSSKLGTYTAAVIKRPGLRDGLICNLYTQYGFASKENPVALNYTALLNGLSSIFAIPGLIIGLPLIGAGLAGGNEQLVRAIIKRAAHEADKIGGADVRLYTLERP